MKRIFCVLILALCLGLLINAAVPATSFAGPETAIANAVVAQAPAQPASAKANKSLTLGMFIFIIVITLYIVYWAAQRTKTTADFYAARSSITAWQNGWAIAGDYMSAATFLGMAGLICLNGLDGFLYPTGWMVAFVTVLLVMAEPCRNSGKYTVGDVLCVRSSPKPVRACAAIATVCVSTFYLTAQMVGAGKLMNLLVGNRLHVFHRDSGHSDHHLRGFRRNDSHNMGPDHKSLPSRGWRRHNLHSRSRTVGLQSYKAF